jgi:tRNA(adenine34) deaminase
MKLDVDVVMKSCGVINKDEYFMREALKQANKALAIDEVPVGCVIVLNDKIIARGYNKREKENLSTNHAEIITINKACKKLNSWRLEDCTMYVTLEPCVMCAGAIIQSRFKRVVYGALDYRFGAHQSITNLFDLKLNHKVEVTSGILEEECSKIITNFFSSLRIKKSIEKQK